VKTDNPTEGVAPAAGGLRAIDATQPALTSWPAPPAISTIPEDQKPGKDGEETQDLGVFGCF